MNNYILAFLAEHWQRLPLDGIDSPPCLWAIHLTPRFRASSHVVSLIFSDGSPDPILVAKVPRLPGDNEGLDREAMNLQAAHMAWAGGRDSIPRVVCYEDYRSHRLLIETALTGQLMNASRVRRQPQICIEAVLSWLINLHSATLTTPVKWFKQASADSLDHFEHHLILNPEDNILLARTRNLTALLHDEEIPLVFEHGDLSAPNILLSARGDPGIVDWELAEPCGLPAVDLFFFLTYIAFTRRRAKKTQQHLAAFHEAFFGPKAWARPYITRYAQALQLSPKTLEPLFALCWSRYVATLLGRLHRANDADESSMANNIDLAAWLRSNRYFSLWDYTVRNFHKLNIVG